MPHCSIRAATVADIEQITAIYRHHVLHGTGTFETSPPDAAEMLRRMQEVHSRGLPWLVAVAGDGQQVAGFAYANWFRAREAYRFTLEDSIYIAPQQQRQGLGGRLLAALIDACTALGARQMLAVIGDSANAGSIGLHRARGFDEIGRMPAVGWKFGRWLDVVLMQRALGAGATTPAV
ncbi:GNAT family N-acetyltransferase [Thiomonas sp.]|jgi:phosphinothricin acetyltransferase|uniref:GNAT family N-acetyltransferase n=1 Tax=Thiomonas sp. TaxID=2047785 RepID=UPI0026179855|nr:GNAT family N-acetyltransferase [Thiomonas sp.]